MLGMAKRKKVLPARKPRDRSRDDSLLLRSAETLGRVIGALQRQLDGATKRLKEADGEVIERIVRKAKGSDKNPRSRKRAASTKTSTRKSSKKR
jgi:hypothetical protein